MDHYQLTDTTKHVFFTVNTYNTRLKKTRIITREEVKFKEAHHVPRGALSSGPASMIWHYMHRQFSNGDRERKTKEKRPSINL